MVRTDVTRVLVLWGGAAEGLRDTPGHRASPDGTVVVAGEALQRWLLGRGRGVLDAARVTELHAQVLAQTQVRDDYEPLEMPSALRFLVRLVGSTLVALFVPALLGEAFGVAGTACAALGIASVAVLARRRAAWRLSSTAGLTVCGFWLTLCLLTLL